ncbi:MAG: hypothetical protein A3A24_02195 [Candidatus Buchananbacteria bacterium RIFCSPLOWO2_01_FULL_46_12]|uniref:Uncharacterized protein n=2 Tax=Candidatus Buchananiibacteriota TaxID=1817903 RepID=A0A1G1YW31_9BACT|nr:MAG: hypothetical protein A2744_00900 [Candidatus Buchananbacteria bacterium RIFCSPHIGHO2_01_FULL_44_11]OGY55780.1 MAG: hypothetical protein A3A24_02195 [Candidatus Buchananbacteria bacterium RIFCSPLOWO2_01_FULL_46_12]
MWWFLGIVIFLTVCFLQVSRQKDAQGNHGKLARLQAGVTGYQTNHDLPTLELSLTDSGICFLPEHSILIIGRQVYDWCPPELLVEVVAILLSEFSGDNEEVRLMSICEIAGDVTGRLPCFRDRVLTHAKGFVDGDPNFSDDRTVGLSTLIRKIETMIEQRA